MKVLIVENMFRGHYYLYLNYILPRLATLVESVDVAISSEGRNSPEFTTYLAPLEKCAGLPPDPDIRGPHRSAAVAPQLARGCTPLCSRLRSCAIRRRRDVAHGALPDRGPRRPAGAPAAEVGIHYGYGASEASRKDRAKDLFYLVTQHLSTWRKIHFANLLFYERAKAWGGSLARAPS